MQTAPYYLEENSEDFKLKKIKTESAEAGLLNIMKHFFKMFTEKLHNFSVVMKKLAP